MDRRFREVHENPEKTLFDQLLEQKERREQYEEKARKLDLLDEIEINPYDDFTDISFDFTSEQPSLNKSSLTTDEFTELVLSDFDDDIWPQQETIKQPDENQHVMLKQLYFDIATQFHQTYKNAADMHNNIVDFRAPSILQMKNIEQTRFSELNKLYNHLEQSTKEIGATTPELEEMRSIISHQLENSQKTIDFLFRKVERSKDDERRISMDDFSLLRNQASFANIARSEMETDAVNSSLHSLMRRRFDLDFDNIMFYLKTPNYEEVFECGLNDLQYHFEKMIASIEKIKEHSDNLREAENHADVTLQNLLANGKMSNNELSILGDEIESHLKRLDFYKDYERNPLSKRQFDSKSLENLIVGLQQQFDSMRSIYPEQSESILRMENTCDELLKSLSTVPSILEYNDKFYEQSFEKQLNITQNMQIAINNEIQVREQQKQYDYQSFIHNDMVPNENTHEHDEEMDIDDISLEL